MKSIKELFYKYEEIISYLIVGGLTTMVSLITYYLLVYTILDPNIGIELQYLLKKVLVFIYLE